MNKIAFVAVLLPLVGLATQSQPFRLDMRSSPRDSTGVEILKFNDDWVDSSLHYCAITVDGIVVTNLSGAGSIVWNGYPGQHEFQLQFYDKISSENVECCDSYTASFDVLEKDCYAPYVVRYNANEGTGDMSNVLTTYNTKFAIADNGFSRVGYSFQGWSTTPTGTVVYQAGAVVSNLIANADGVVDLYAVWSVMRQDGGPYTEVVDGREWSYVIKNGIAMVGDGTSPAISSEETGGVVIPEFLGGRVVAGVSSRAFYGHSGVTNISIPAGVEVIGQHAFAWCPRLRRLEIPKNVRQIGRWAFLCCHGMTGIDVQEGNSSYSSVDGVLFDADKNTLIAYPTGRIGEYGILHGVTNIEGFAFCDCHGLPRVTIPSSVVSIGEQAFSTCENLAEIILIGNAPQTVGWGAFDGVDDYCNAVVFSGTTGWDDDGDGLWQFLPLRFRDRGNLPEIGDVPSSEDVADAVKYAADEKVLGKIDAVNYNDFRNWAGKVKTKGGSAAGAQGVMNADNAWLSYALGQDTLLDSAPTDGDLSVKTFVPAAEAGKFDFTVSVGTIEVGSAAAKENLKKVFGLEGATTLEGSAFSSDKVDIEFGAPVEGKVKFTATPKETDAKSFFMKVKMLP